MDGMDISVWGEVQRTFGANKNHPVSPQSAHVRAGNPVQLLVFKWRGPGFKDYTFLEKEIEPKEPISSELEVETFLIGQFDGQ